MKRKFMSIILISSLMITLIGCGKSSETTSSGYAKELYFYNWTEYMPDNVFKEFESEYGIKVVKSTFSSNEELLAKLTSGGGNQYDIAIASNYVIEAMKKQELIQEIDKNEITNIKNIEPSMLNLEFDPENKYTIPYMGTATVLVVNKEKLKELGVEIKSYDDLLNPKLANNIVVVDDSREIVGLALQAQGKDLNSKNEKDILGTQEWLNKFTPNIKAYDSDSPKTLLISNDVAAGYIYCGDAALAIKENPDLEVVYFDNKSLMMSLDNFVITANAKHKKEAELFINFILRPEISKEISDSFPYISVNKEAKALFGDDYKNNSAINIPKSALDKTVYIEDVGEAVQAYDDVFTKIKVGHTGK